MNTAEILTAVGSLPFWLQIILVFLFFIVFTIVVFSVLQNGFKIKFLHIKFDGLKSIKKKIENNGFSFSKQIELFNKIQDIDISRKLKIKSAFRKLELIKYDEDKCNLSIDILYYDIKDYMYNWIDENHLIQKALMDNEECEKQTMEFEIKKIVQNYEYRIKNIKTFCKKLPKVLAKKSDIDKVIKKNIDVFYEDFKAIVLDCCRKKIEIYQQMKPIFENTAIYESALLVPLSKNENYIKQINLKC